ncbi:hypothetical protein [Massilia sp. PWRC2]
MMLGLIGADDRLSLHARTLVSQAMTRWGLELHTILAHRQPL